MYDLKITGGTIIDGTGAAGFVGDVGIVDGNVVAIGGAPDDGATTVDATGRVVSPGFVDIHTHYDAQIMWDRTLSVSPWHGVTSVVMGNCGFGVAPTKAADRDTIIKTLEKVEGMDATALRAGLGDDWGFESFPEYLDAVDARGSSINVAAMIGHTPLRLSVLGADSTEREATLDEVAIMRAAVREALEAGAIGFATSKSDTHVGAAGKPVPSRLSTTAEIAEIAQALGDVDRGIMQATLGRGLLWDEMRAISESNGRPISWTALLAGAGGEDAWKLMLELSSKILDDGVPVHPQVSCRPLNFEFTMAQPFPFESMRNFAPISQAPDDATKVAIYEDKAWRDELKASLAAGHGGVLGGSWARTVFSYLPADPSLHERNVAEVAAERGVDPTDLVLDLALESGLAARFRLAALNWDEDAVEVLLTDPHTMLGLSDAGAHASQLCDACFSTHLLSRWVRERKALTLEEAVRKLTSETADIFGLIDRGRLAVGKPADVVVFDAATVGCSPLRRVADQPGGAERLVSDAIGIDAVIVNGTIIRRDGVDAIAADGPMPGRLLRA